MIKIITSLLITSAVASLTPHHHARRLTDTSVRGETHLLGLLGRQSCNTGDVACSDGCYPSGSICCSDSEGGACASPDFCWPNSNHCCQIGYVVCGDGCMPAGSNCCDSTADYCGAGDTCIVGDKCCPGGGNCAGTVTTYAAGSTITATPAATAIPSTAPPSTSPESTPFAAAPTSTAEQPTASVESNGFTTPAASTHVGSPASTSLVQPSVSAGAAAHNLPDFEVYVAVALAAGHVLF